MAKQLINPKVGSLVYKPYEPNNPGKVKKVLNPNTSLTNPNIILPSGHLISIKTQLPVEVAWFNGGITIEASEHLHDFDALIAEHQKKLNTHTSKLPQLALL